MRPKIVVEVTWNGREREREREINKVQEKVLGSE
jgi:hypothetical protein